jgi:hypothetical protein
MMIAGWLAEPWLAEPWLARSGPPSPFRLPNVFDIGM